MEDTTVLPAMRIGWFQDSAGTQINDELCDVNPRLDHVDVFVFQLARSQFVDLVYD